MTRKFIGIIVLSLITGACLGILGMSLFFQKKPNEITLEQPKAIKDSSVSDKNSEKDIPDKPSTKVERNTTNQKEFDALSDLGKEFINVFYKNTPTISKQDKEKAVSPYLSDIGRTNLLKDYNYQEGTDVAITNPLTAKIYVNFDSITGTAVIMAFMIYQTKYEDNAPTNAQTIVRITCSKNKEDSWEVDDSEMRLLNQPMPQSYYS